MPSEPVPPAAHGPADEARAQQHMALAASLAPSPWGGAPVPTIPLRFNAQGLLVENLAALSALTGMPEEALSKRGWLAALAEEDRASASSGWERAVRERLPFAAALRVRVHASPDQGRTSPSDALDQVASSASQALSRAEPHYAWMMLHALPLIVEGTLVGWSGILAPVPAATSALDDTAGSVAANASPERAPATAHGRPPIRKRSPLSASLLITTFETMTDGVAISDRDGHILHVNGAMRAFYARAGVFAPTNVTMAERCRTLQMRQLDGTPLPPDAWPLARLLRGTVLTGSTAMQARVSLPDGTLATESFTGAPLRDEAGDIVGAVCVMRDTTESQHLTQHLRERASQLETIFAAMADAVFLYDAQGRIVEMNRAAHALLAADHEPEHTARDLEARIGRYHLSDEQGNLVARDLSPMARILRGEVLMGNQAVDLILTNLAGEQVRVSYAGAPVRDEAGHILGAVGICRDVTRRRQLEAQSHSALEVLLAVAHLVGNPQAWTTMIDLLGRVTEVLCRLEAVDYVHTMLVAEDDTLIPVAMAGVEPAVEARWRVEAQAESRARQPEYAKAIARLRAGEVFAQRFDHEPPLLTPSSVAAIRVRAAISAPILVNGHLRALIDIGRARTPDPASASGFAPWDEDLLAGVSRLIGEALSHAALADQLRAAELARAVAEETTRQRDAFIGIAGHELRTPLTTVTANAQLLERGLRQLRALLDDGQLTPTEIATRLARLSDHAERVSRRSAVLARLISDLVDVSRIHGDRLELDSRSHDLTGVLREVIAEQRQTNPGRTIEVVGLDDGTTLPVLVDADRIAQVVTNYLTNALKYAPPELPVVVSVSRQDGVARIAVHDDGPGLAAEQQRQIWERFYRAPGIEVKSGSGVGLGLGLYIARSIVERHGGTVGVESAPGQGSTFWFTIPLAPQQ